jgi:hypothetical protein
VTASAHSGNFGTQNRVVRGSQTAADQDAVAFAAGVAGSHANAFHRHVSNNVTVVGGQPRPSTARMDAGNLVEQNAYDRMTGLKSLGLFTKWQEGVHFLYQSSLPSGVNFPVDYRSGANSGRPDFRYAFYGQEVVLDITTASEAGDVLNKVTSAGTVGNDPNIPIAVEIVWEDIDFYVERDRIAELLI